MTLREDDPIISKNPTTRSEEEARHASPTVMACFKVYKEELKELVTLAWPVALSSLFAFLPTTVALIFCGQLGKENLDAVALAISVINVTGIFICIGLSTACDTLFAQAYGGKNLQLMCVYFQRGLIIISLSCFLCWCVHLNAERLLLLLHQDPLISRLAAEYILLSMPGLIANFVYQVSTRFLQTQNIVIPTVIMGFIANVFNTLAHYVLVYVLDQGIRGSAIAGALTWLVSCLLALVYIRASGILTDCWKGWSIQVLENWGSFLKLALAGLAMIATEWCTYECGIFLTGLLGIVEQGATSISFQIDWALYMIILGFSTACCIRVGHNLGAVNSDGAKTSYRVAQITTSCVIVLTTLALILLKDVIPLVFTNDEAVRNLVSRFIPLMGAVLVLDSVTGVSTGALRGCGEQWIGGVLNFLGYFMVVLPVAVGLMFYTDQGAVGFWWGLVIGVIPLFGLYIIAMAGMDWEFQARKAVINTTDKKIQLSGENVPDSKQDLKDGAKSTEESALLQKQPPGQSTRCLIVKRLAVCSIVFTVFIISICLRVFITPPP